jgi:hypothetical protein
MKRSIVLRGFLACFASTLLAATAAAADTGFSFQDVPGKHLDVRLDGRIVARYMYECDKSTPERRLETYKPYLHVFDAEGKAPITKGPGGNYTHHRGIFIGWRKIDFQGKSYDRWHMKGGEIVHQKFLQQEAGPDQAVLTSLTNWNDESEKPIVTEERTMTFRRAPAPARLIIDFTAKLTAPRGDIVLDGDPEHAGVQYRPAQEVDTKATLYVFPRENPNPHKDLDYPWVGETYTLSGKHYSVVDMNHPENPKETHFSAYRDYGRFGGFFKKPIKSGESLTVRYRFLIADGDMPATDVIEKCFDQFTAATTPSPVPKITVMLSEQPKPKPAKAPAKPKKPAAEKSPQPK